MPAAITTFRNVRARLNPAGEKGWLTGWVMHLAREESRIRLWSFVSLPIGSRVACECYGQGTVARFTGTVLAQAGKDVAIDLVGSITYSPSDETPRIYTTGLAGELIGGDGPYAMTVLDVSPLSLGVLTDREFSAHDELSMELPTKMGPVAASVCVMNCRPDPDSPGQFRLGLNIIDMPRLDRARWGRLVVERAEA